MHDNRSARDGQLPEVKMAGFCTKCGSPLDDVQAFCARCGTPADAPPARASATPPPPASSTPSVPPAISPQPKPPSLTPVPAPQAAGASAKSGNTLVKVLLVFVVVIFVFGAIGAVGIWYVANKAKEKFHEIGLDELSDASKAARGSVLPGIDPC